MGKIYVIGIGNRLMMDDGIGIYLVDELVKEPCSAKVHYLIGESDIDYCLDYIEEASFIIILDAVVTGKQPGVLSIFPLSEIQDYQTTMINLSPHNLHLLQFLNHQKNSLEGFLVGIEAYKIEFHVGLSQNIKDKWKDIFQEVNNTVTTLLTKCGHL